MIPVEFIDRLNVIFPEETARQILDSFSSPEALSIRINTLKTSLIDVVERLKPQHASFTPVPWGKNIFILNNISREEISRHPLTLEGRIYQQSLSSMIPAIALDPKPEETILDACAAPGSKTTQIASMMEARGMLIAVESVKSRFFRLKSVVGLLGAVNASCKLCDIRRFKPYGDILFDRILVDAPCSSEGRFRANGPDSTAYWSPRKVKEMSFKQKGILMSASRLLKPGGVLVYATCTFSPDENEGVIDWFLRKNMHAFTVEEINLPGIPQAKNIMQWQRDEYAPDVLKCLRVNPCQGYTGFFVAKLRKL